MQITIKPQILKVLREDRTIPLEAMPTKLGIVLDEYKKLEAEDSVVSIEFANKIASIFNRNWSVFLLDQIPQKTKIDHDNRTIENQSPTFHEKTIEALEDSKFILEFSKNLHTHQGLQIPNYDKIKAMDAETLGTYIREESNISIDDQKEFSSSAYAFKAWYEFVESKGIYISQYPLNNEDNIRAFSMSENNRAIITLNSKDTVPGKIFSLFHEFCHILRRNAGVCDLHDSDVEIFCNRFAAAFLIPISDLSSYTKDIKNYGNPKELDLYVSKISKDFKVSKLVVYRRFNTAGLISDETYSKIHQKFVREFTAKKKVSKENSSGGPDYYIIRRVRNGKYYSMNVLQAFDSGEISAFEASNALDVGVQNLDKYRLRVNRK